MVEQEVGRRVMPSRSREQKKEADRQASWDRLRNSPWNPFGIARASGCGRPRIQLVHLPSFSPPAFWEICQRDTEWVLYSAKVADKSWYSLTVQGYEPTTFESTALQAYFRRLTSLTLPIAPDYSGYSGLDGEVTLLTLRGDRWSEVRYQWWSHPPSGWEPLVTIVKEMLTLFEPLAGERQ